ncbi:MAG: hypothetical protein DWI59_02290 [Chloroflexi bacterium]|nr:MAG: hypothetical protein DWI59_02290 [Chloroflexota bacterium]
MVQASDDASWMGRGWAFPPEFDVETRGAVMASGADDIQQSLLILLSTSPGERVMNPAYGCNLRAMVFENISEPNVTLIRDAIERAVLLFERRVLLNSVEVDTDEARDGVIWIRLDYTIRSTNSAGNLVYPFSIQDGTSGLGSVVPAS